MNLFPHSVSFVLGNETYMRHGQLVSLYEDARTGECSNFGISLKWFRGIEPGATADDIKALTQNGATRLYWQYFWDDASLAWIAHPSIAAKVLDAEVNMGPSQGVRLIQKALCVIVDGHLGPNTAADCNAADETKLYDSFVMCAADRYQRIRDAQIPKYGQGAADKNLSQWLARLAKRPAPFHRETSIDMTTYPGNANGPSFST